jgi:hypothetical protein
MLYNVGRDDTAHGDNDDVDELFTLLISQLPVHFNLAILDDRCQWPRSLRRGSLACRDRGFECRRGYGRLSLVNVVR